MTSDRLQELAEEVIEKEKDGWVAKARLVAMPSGILLPHQYLVLDCVDCGEELELFRLQKGRTRCVECQTISERRR